MSSAVVVGAGISGVACAQVLRAGGVDVTVLDRGRRPGGRLGERSVQLAAEGGGAPDGGATHVVDTGAAYFTVEDPDFAALAASWSARGLARPWTDTLHLAGPDGLRGTTTGPQRWASPTGLRSLVDDLARGLEVRSSTTVASVGVTHGLPSADGRGADAVVLAMPDPQAARLLDVAAADGLAAARRVLSRPWQPVVSVYAVYERRWWPELDAAFVADDEVITLIADDGRRRGDGAPVLVAHAGADASAAHLSDPDALVGPVLAHAAAALGVPAPPAPLAAAAQRWSHSSPAESHDDPFHLAGVADGLLGVCGDAWGGKSRVERAWVSGRDLGRALLDRL